MIHIVNGDVVGAKLNQQIVGEVIVWREMYDYGPLLQDGSREEQLRQRASFFERKLEIPAAFFEENGIGQWALLDNLPMDAEITLWFEHDRYDQWMLIYLLQELSGRGFQKLWIVTLNEYTGIEPFYGLGQLSTPELIDLFHTHRSLVTAEQMREATEAWAALTSTDPHKLEEWIASTMRELPYLRQAMQHHIEYFPSAHTGLNLVETLALEYLKGGTRTFVELFRYVTENRPCDGLSDLHFAAILKELMNGEHPLLESDAPLPNYLAQGLNAKLQITTWGLDVLHGNKDRFEYVGIDWWLGGVHLQDGKWRRDAGRIVEFF